MRGEPQGAGREGAVKWHAWTHGETTSRVLAGGVAHHFVRTDLRVVDIHRSTEGDYPFAR